MAKIDLRSWHLVNQFYDKDDNYAKEFAKKKTDKTWEYVAVKKTFATGKKGHEIFGRLKKPIYANSL